MKNVNKMFGVLVLGGAMLVQLNAEANEHLALDSNQEPICKVEVTGTKEGFSGPEKKHICLDGKTDEEVDVALKEVEEFSNECRSEFCGCWLG